MKFVSGNILSLKPQPQAKITSEPIFAQIIEPAGRSAPRPRS